MKNVIFLGAGASKADGTPLQHELFENYFSMIEYKMEQYTEIRNFFHNEGLNYNVLPNCDFEFRKQRLKEFFKDFFGLSNNDEYPTFEEVLGITEMSFQRNEEFFGITKYKLTDCQADLINAITETIEFSQKKSNSF